LSGQHSGSASPRYVDNFEQLGSALA
jgi:hypothetical protein